MTKDSVEFRVRSLLGEIDRGDPKANAALIEVLYDDLRRLARMKMARERPQTLQPTALVHQAWMRLERATQPLAFNDRRHYLNCMGRAMQRILVERGRKHRASERLDDAPEIETPPALREIAPEAFGRAIDKLDGVDPEAAGIVRLKYVLGLTWDEVSTSVGMTVDQARERGRRGLEALMVAADAGSPR